MTLKSEWIGADSLARALLDAMPIPVFLVDQNVRILDCNPVGMDMLNGRRGAAFQHRYGEILQCLEGMCTGQPCPYSSDCTPCLVEQAIATAFAGTNIVRRKFLLQRSMRGNESDVYYSATRIEIKGQPMVMLAIEDIGQVANIRSLIPICSCCRRIRGDDNAWHGLEGYLTRSHHLDFTHDLCPECLKASLAEAIK